MSLEHTIRLLAGTMVLASLLIGHLVNERWYFLAVFVGLNLIQSSFTKWCIAESVIRKFYK